MRVPLAGLLLLFAGLAPRSAHAQPLDPRLAPPRVEWRWMDAAAAPAPAVVHLREPGSVAPGWLALAGLTGGALGLVGGAVAGGWLDGPPDDDCIDFCFGPGFVLGALAGEALGVSTAVHLANGRKGSYPWGLATSAGILFVGITAGHEAPSAGLLIPVSQIFGTVVVERTTERRRRR